MNLNFILPSKRSQTPKTQKYYMILLIWVFFVCLFRWVFVAVQGFFSITVESGGYSPVVMHGLLIAVASSVAKHGLQGIQASLVAALGLSSYGSWA